MVPIDALQQRCTAASIETERDALASTLRMLNQLILIGAQVPLVIRIADLAVERCRNCFDNEEKFMRDRVVNFKAHVAAHAQLMVHVLNVRSAIYKGDLGGMLEAVKLVHGLRDHADTFDIPTYAGGHSQFGFGEAILRGTYPSNSRRSDHKQSPHDSTW